jgi:2-keto-4-pentenoate hydratase/2-oxohepta-3-ene-1,7-dioic acid hydratase in catechol pathway
MEIRRVRHSDGTLRTETRPTRNDAWQPSTPQSALGFDSPFSDRWEAEHAQQHAAQPDGPALPFQPLSVRDFSLSEQHNVNAGKGYANRFMPGVARIARGLEAVTRRPPRALRPNRLWYSQPIYYLNNPLTFVPSGTPVAFPPYTKALDYELQLAFVINRPLYDAKPEDAERAIAAFVVMCDFSARDVQIPEMKSGMGPQKAKHFVSSMSTIAVSADEILPRWRELRGSVTVNGDVIARPHTADSRYSLGEMLAHASAGEQLHPGELFSIGCLADGSGMEIGHWVQPGDTVRLELPAVGGVEHLIK